MGRKAHGIKSNEYYGDCVCLYICVCRTHWAQKVNGGCGNTGKEEVLPSNAHTFTHTHTHSDNHTHTPSSHINSLAPCRLCGGWSVGLILAARVWRSHTTLRNTLSRVLKKCTRLWEKILDSKILDGKTTIANTRLKINKTSEVKLVSFKVNVLNRGTELYWYESCLFMKVIHLKDIVSLFRSKSHFVRFKSVSSVTICYVMIHTLPSAINYP